MTLEVMMNLLRETISQKVHGVRGAFGTGVWPFLVGGAHYSSHMGVSLEGSDLTILGVARKYIAVLYLPLFPLGLTAFCYADEYRRECLALDKENMETLCSHVGRSTSMRRHHRGTERLRTSWLSSAIVSVVSATFGWLVGYLNWSFLGGICGMLLASGVGNYAFIGYLRHEVSFRY
jgi:hypothetical protein